jgi:hypothetical protein
MIKTGSAGIVTRSTGIASSALYAGSGGNMKRRSRVEIVTDELKAKVKDLELRVLMLEADRRDSILYPPAPMTIQTEAADYTNYPYCQD